MTDLSYTIRENHRGSFAKLPLIEDIKVPAIRDAAIDAHLAQRELTQRVRERDAAIIVLREAQSAFDQGGTKERPTKGLRAELAAASECADDAQDALTEASNGALRAHARLKAAIVDNLDKWEAKAVATAASVRDRLATLSLEAEKLAHDEAASFGVIDLIAKVRADADTDPTVKVTAIGTPLTAAVGELNRAAGLAHHLADTITQGVAARAQERRAAEKAEKAENEAAKRRVAHRE